MYNVNILVSENGILSTVFGPFDMLIQAGVFWNMLIDKKATPYFNVQIVSTDGKEIEGLGGAKIQPHNKIGHDDQFDLIIVPSEGMNIQPNNPSFIQRTEYIKAMHKKGAVIASICTGAFLVAATGLLDNKRATTHWALAKEFKSLFPKVELNTNLLIVDNHKIITSGGVNADMDLSMHIIANFCGQEVALQTARCTLVDLTLRQQTPYKTFITEKKHGDEDILKCQNYIEKHHCQEITLESLSEKFHLSKRTLSRRFKQATSFTVISYIQQFRVEKAKFTLERENISFDELSYSLGYENVSFFRRLFKQYVGITPSEYRRAFFRSY